MVVDTRGEIEDARSRPTTDSMLQEIADIAANLDEPTVVGAVESIRTHNGAARLQLLVLGLPGSGRATLANALLGETILPESPVPKSDVTISLGYDERRKVTVRKEDGAQMAAPPERLGAMLRDTTRSTDGLVAVGVNNPVLDMCDVRIDSLQRDHSISEWREILGSADFVLLIVGATALLSEAEKRFVRDHLVPAGRLERSAVVINKMDLIPKDEQASIVDLVRTFLGRFESQPAILEIGLGRGETAGVSAPADDGLAGSEPATDEANPEPAVRRESREALRTLLANLVEQRMGLRSQALRVSLETLIDDLQRSASTLEGLYQLEESDVRELLDTIASGREWLQGRIDRSHGRVQAFVQTLLKEGLLRRMEEFAVTFRNRLPDEIGSVEDISVIRRHLPGYIETVWAEFMAQETAVVRRRLGDEAAQLDRIIESDLQELISQRGPVALQARLSAEKRSDMFRVFVMPRRGKHRVSNLAGGLGFYGLFALYFSPVVGILSLGATQLLQRAFAAEIAKADRDAVLSSAMTASRELERDLKRRIEEQFAATAERMKADVARAYHDGIAEVTAILEKRAAEEADIAVRRRELLDITATRLPDLRRRAAGITA